MRLSHIHSYYYSQRGRGYSEEYQAVLDAGIGTAPSASQQTKQNTLVTDLKTAGIWDLLDVFYVFATDGDSDFATLNWKSPGSFRITKVSSPTFTTNDGFRPSGVGSYLNTGWIPSTNGVNYTLNDASFGVYIQTNAQSNSFDCGTVGSDGVTTRTWASSRLLTDSSQFNINSTGALQPTVLDSSGLFHIQRLTGATSRIMRNGSSISTTATSAQALSDRAFYVGTYNNNGTAAAAVTNRTYSAFFAGADLDGKESSLYTALNNYLTSL